MYHEETNKPTSMLARLIGRNLKIKVGGKKALQNYFFK